MSFINFNNEARSIPITVIIAVKNESLNISKCLSALSLAKRVIVIDSQSTDNTAELVRNFGHEIVQFKYLGGYPKKRQWALDNLKIETEWILLLDADEVVPLSLWSEIMIAINSHPRKNAFFIRKGFHFLGKEMKFGGFSHAAILLFRNGKARFEKSLESHRIDLDMEVHERIIVSGDIGKLLTPLIHEDFKGLEGYISRHNQYSTWEAELRTNYFTTGLYGSDTIPAKFFGNPQERRRALKNLIIRIPFESSIWFFYHYFLRLGILEGKRGPIACQIRASYISQVRAKIYELNDSRLH